MIADMHRARHLAWELPAHGWDVEVLSPDESYQTPSCLDEDSAGFFAPGTPVAAAPESRPWLYRALGMRSIGWRSMRAMRRAGDRLLARGRFDLVYISTTQFPLFLLGPRWQRRHGVPFVLDFHDPCFREDAAPPVWAQRSLRHEVSRRLARYIESRAVAAASGLVAVSQDYLATLRRRYAHQRPKWLLPGKCATIPFGVLPRDLEEAGKAREAAEVPAGELLCLVYVGVGGPVMARSFGLFCRTMARVREAAPEAAAGLRVGLYGTMMGWSEGDPRPLAQAAAAHGVADLVQEDPGRVSYRRSLQLLLAARGALILGVDDAAYMPSKLFTYGYSGKPLLAVVRRDGPAYEAMRGLQDPSAALWFEADREISPSEGAAVLETWLGMARRHEATDRRISCEPFLASTMARHHAELFAESCAGGQAR